MAWWEQWEQLASQIVTYTDESRSAYTTTKAVYATLTYCAPELRSEYGPVFVTAVTVFKRLVE